MPGYAREGGKEGGRLKHGGREGGTDQSQNKVTHSIGGAKGREANGKTTEFACVL